MNTVPAGILGDADTIIYRMDDAVFDKDGVATTRVKFMALSLASIEPFQTECGQFHAAIRLKGEQPVTSMRIERTDRHSGIYSATLAVKANVTFTPLGGDASRTLELDQNVQFVPSRSVWTRQPGANAPAAKNFARVDVDGDGQAETAIPGPSNFRPGFIVKDGALARATFQEIARAVSPSPCPVQIAAASSASSTTTRICPEGCHCSPNLNWGDPVPPECWQTTNCDHCHCPWGSDPR